MEQTKNLRGGYFSDYLSRPNTVCLKGIFACFILIHHLYQRSELLIGSYLGIVLQAMGYLSVAVFFFISGFGLEESYRCNGNAYINRLPRNRILPFYTNCFVLVGIYAILYFVLGIMDEPVKQITSSALFGGTVIVGGWYLQAILILYLFYWAITRGVQDDKRRYIFITLFLILYCIFCNYIGLTHTWYQSVFAFELGILWSHKRGEVDSFTFKHWWLCTASAFILFAVTFIMGSRNHLSNMFSAVFFVVLVLLLLMKISVNNAVTRWLGKYSFEIYVMQGIPFLLLHSNLIYIENQWLYVLLCTIITLILAVAIHPVFQFINTTVRREVIA